MCCLVKVIYQFRVKIYWHLLLMMASFSYILCNGLFCTDLSRTVTQPPVMWPDPMYINHFLSLCFPFEYQPQYPPKSHSWAARHWWLRGQPLGWAQVQLLGNHSNYGGNQLLQDLPIYQKSPLLFCSWCTDLSSMSSITSLRWKYKISIKKNQRVSIAGKLE